MSQLDKFKRRLIRSVARLRVDEKKPEKEVWEILSKEMGCDCAPLWERMRALTMKKLGRLLICGDCTDTIANVALPSDSDMLMFDLVLAHEEDFDVIGVDMLTDKSKDCKALVELFELVQEFSLEETAKAALAETWAEALAYYNSTGNRLTSLMLLQRRWYQLKELTRANFYKLWHSYRGNTHLWNKARAECTLTDLQVNIAERYPYVITKPFRKWDVLVKAGMIILPQHNELIASDKNDASGNEQDLVLLEPQVETISLDVDSDSETERGSCPRDVTVQPKSADVPKQTNEGNIATAAEYNPNITIKTEPPDLDGLSNVKILEATHIPVLQSDDTRQSTIKTEDIDPRVAMKNDLLRNISKCIESTDELIKQCDPQEDQCENANEAEDQMGNIIEQRSSENVTEDKSDPQTSKHEVIEGKAFDYFRNKILENMSKSSNYEETTKDVVQRKGSTDGELCRSNVPEDNIGDSLSSEEVETVIEEKTIDDVKSSEEVLEEDNIRDSLSSEEVNTVIEEKTIDDVRSSEEEVIEDIIKQTADDFVNKSKHSRAAPGALTLTDVTIVDDGIDFVDDGIEYNEDNEDRKMETDGDSNSSIGTEKQEDKKPSIDLKLLMAPIVVSTRLNDMLAFKDREFASVVDRSTIDLAELESKPKQAVKEPIKEVHVKQEHKCDDDSNSDSDDCSDDVISDDQRVKLTSYLLQKPRSRSYNPIQLCKNPDFNTRLKRLTFGFLSSERNRLFLSALKPATVDLHKAFEDKLINGTLYLKRSVRTDFVKETSVQKDDLSIRTVSVVPSAMSVQSLIDSSKLKFQPSSTVSSVDLTSDDMSERNKIIHLPDITQVRRINQKLLTAEVPPIRVQNNVTSAAPPSYSDVQPVVKNMVTNELTTKIGQKSNDYNKTSQEMNKNTAPLLSNLLASYRPPSFPKSLKISATQNNLEKQIGTPPTIPDEPPANPVKPKRKPPTKKIGPYLSWNKPLIETRPLDDFLITHDTLLKILAKAKNLTEYQYTIEKKNTNNKTQKGVKDIKGMQKEPNIQKNKHKEAKKIEVTKYIQQNKKEEVKKNEVIKDQNYTQLRKSTKMKPKSTKRGIMKTICCWARAWLYKNKGQLLRLPKHMCPVGDCNCCCKNELPQSNSKEIYENSEPIELSDEESNKNFNLTTVIECVVKQSIQVPVPKLRLFSTDQHNFNKKDTNINLDPTSLQENTPSVEKISDKNKVESSTADNTLRNVVIDEESSPVADVQGEVTVVADDIVQTSTEKHKSIFVIPEAKIMQMNVNKPNVVKPNFQVVRASNQSISTQNQRDFIPPLISSSVSKKMYIKKVYSKPSQKPPSVSMSTQTMDGPILKNLVIDQKGQKCIEKPDTINQKQLVVDGTRPFTTPTTIVNKNTEQVIHLNPSKLSSSNPIYLGKNQILLTTVKFPANFESPKKENDRKELLVPKVVPSFSLPEGVEIVLQPNGDLACVVKPGVELDSTQVSMLPSILEAVKQQISTQQPYTISDVINVSDDEIEQNISENINTSKTNQENALTSSVVQTQKVEKSSRKQIVDDTEHTHALNQENETDKEAKLMIHQKNMTKQKSICEETNVCQIQGADTLESEICLNKTNEHTDEAQSLIKNTTMIQKENKKCEEDKLVDNIHSSIETESEEKETQENSKLSAGSRNLLSDLMEMSGISEEDTKTAEPTLPTLPAVINLAPVIDPNETNHFPNLTPVVSVAQLKYACEQNGKFFKLDFDTGTLVPLSVCIKKKGFNTFKLQGDTVEFAVRETGAGDKVGIPKVSAPVTSYDSSSAISPTFTPKKNSFVIQRHKRNIKNPVFSKPITILRHTRPQSLLRNQLHPKKRAHKRRRKEIPERIEAKIDLVDSDAPMEEEYLINSESDDDMVISQIKIPKARIELRPFAVKNTVTEISDDSSDDEPLALKSKRMRSDVPVPTHMVSVAAETINEEHQKKIQELLINPGQNIANEEVEKGACSTDADSMEVDTDIPAGVILEDVVSEPDEVDSDNSPDCILGM